MNNHLVCSQSTRTVLLLMTMYSWEKITQKFLHSIKNTGKDLTMKLMFDISEKLTVGQSDGIYGRIQFTGMILHGNIHL